MQELADKNEMKAEDREVVLAAALDRANKELANGNARAAIHFGEIASKFAPEDFETKLLISKANLSLKNYHEARKLLDTIPDNRITRLIHWKFGASPSFSLKTI